MQQVMSNTIVAVCGPLLVAIFSGPKRGGGGGGGGKGG